MTLTAEFDATISVVVRFAVPPLPPGRNSETRPVTSAESPARAAGAALVKTKMPSEVAGSASGCACCIQKPLPVAAVTIPATPRTVCPAIGDRWAEAWISAMVGGGPGGSLGPLAELAGEGEPAVKSAALLSVSVPSSARLAEAVFERPPAGPLPSKSFALPYPTKSRTFAAASQSASHPSAAWSVTKATLPPVAPIAIDPDASGAGRSSVPPAPAASATR